MTIELYYAPNTCALAPYITLTEANAAFEVHPLNFRKHQQMSSEYLALNPKHKVPLLVVDGRTLTENAAIHLWIARNFPHANLMPTNPWQELQAISIHSWCSSGIHPYLSRINNLPRVCDVPGAGPSVLKAATALLFESFTIADTMLKGRDFFFDHFTAADAHFFWCMRRSTQFDLDLSGFPNCLAHFERVKARPSAQKAFAFEQSVVAEFATAA